MPVRLTACACALALLAIPPRLEAQGPTTWPTHSWDALVGTLAIGTRVQVTRLDHTAVRGTLLAIDARSITVGQDSARQVVDATAVLRVARADLRRRRALRVGIPLGMLVGGLAMTAIDSRSGHPEPAEAFLMGAFFIGLPVGAVAAVAWPVGPPLYEAAPQ